MGFPNKFRLVFNPFLVLESVNSQARMVLPNKKNGCGFYTEKTHSPVQKPSGSWFQCIPTPVWNTFHPHFILVSNAFLPVFHCIPSWFRMHSFLVSNAFLPGFQCIPSWFPMHSFLVSIAFHPGFQYIPSWFPMHSILIILQCI